MGFFGVFERTTSKRPFSYLPKISFPGQIVFQILAQLCSVDSIQILLNLTQFITSEIESNLEGFVWSHQSKPGLVSTRQFAQQCKFLGSSPFQMLFFQNIPTNPIFQKLIFMPSSL